MRLFVFVLVVYFVCAALSTVVASVPSVSTTPTIFTSSSRTVTPSPSVTRTAMPSNSRSRTTTPSSSRTQLPSPSLSPSYSRTADPSTSRTTSISATLSPIVSVTSTNPACSAFPIQGIANGGNITLFGSTINQPHYSNSQCDQGSSGTVWYSIVPGNFANVTITTCSAYTNFDTVLGLYTGTCNNLYCYMSNDDAGCSGGGSTIRFTANGGQYFISVSGYSTNAGNFELIVTATAGSDPSCAQAIRLPGPYFTPVVIDGTNAGAPSTTYTTCGLSSNSYSIWYQISPAVGAPLDISTCNTVTNFDTQIAVFSGTCSDLTCQIVNDDNCTSGSSTASNVYFTPTQSSYYVAVFGYGSLTGYYQLSISQEQAPAQSGCSDAYPVALGSVSSLEGSTSTGAILGIPVCSSERGAAIWYHVTSNRQQSVTFSTCNSDTNFDTFLSIYSGNCNSLSCIAYNDDYCSTKSQVTINVFTNESFYLVISGYSGQVGDYIISITTN